MKRTGREGERVDRLGTEQRPGISHSGGLESDGVGDRAVGRDSHGGWAEVSGRVEEIRGRCG